MATVQEELPQAGLSSAITKRLWVAPVVGEGTVVPLTDGVVPECAWPQLADNSSRNGGQSLHVSATGEPRRQLHLRREKRHAGDQPAGAGWWRRRQSGWPARREGRWARP